MDSCSTYVNPLHTHPSENKSLKNFGKYFITVSGGYRYIAQDVEAVEGAEVQRFENRKSQNFLTSSPRHFFITVNTSRSCNP